MVRVDQSSFVLIDVQGKLATLMFERQRLVENLQILLKGARILNLPILWLEQYPKGLGPTVPEVAEILDCHYTTVHHKIRAGIIPISPLSGAKSTRVLTVDLRRLMGLD